MKLTDLANTVPESIGFFYLNFDKKRISKKEVDETGIFVGIEVYL